MTKKPARDPAQELTDFFIKKLEEGVKPWERPWDKQASVNVPLRHNGEPYHGINHFYLDLLQYSYGYVSPYWLTFKQAQALGGNVSKGATGQISIFYRTVVKSADGDSSEEAGLPDEDTKARYSYKFLKYYIVFNADQIEGLPDHFYPSEEMEREEKIVPPSSRQREIDTFFHALPIKLSHRGGRAFYRPATDEIVMPPTESFKSMDHYAGVLAHECCHWTGGKNRLARRFERFKSEAYAREELIAEMGSYRLCRHLGLPAELDDNHASYVASWLKILKNDKTAILAAAAKAEEAFALLLSYQPQEELREAA